MRVTIGPNYTIGSKEIECNETVLKPLSHYTWTFPERTRDALSFNSLGRQMA